MGELDRVALPPRHKHYQFFVSGEDELSVAVVQRSADILIGVGWNRLNAALVLELMAKETGLRPREVVWYGLDVHLYVNHVDQSRKQIAREPRPFPTLTIKRKAAAVWEYQIEDLELAGYEPHDHIPAPIAV